MSWYLIKHTALLLIIINDVNISVTHKHFLAHSSFGKDLLAGAFIEACYDNFFNETIEYDITNEEPARFFEKIIRIINQKILPLDKLINQQEGILAYKVINDTFLLNDFLNH